MPALPFCKVVLRAPNPPPPGYARDQKNAGRAHPKAAPGPRAHPEGAGQCPRGRRVDGHQLGDEGEQAGPGDHAPGRPVSGVPPRRSRLKFRVPPEILSTIRLVIGGTMSCKAVPGASDLFPRRRPRLRGRIPPRLLPPLARSHRAREVLPRHERSLHPGAYESGRQAETEAPALALVGPMEVVA